jgi:S-formylglutathione hydrolase
MTCSVYIPSNENKLSALLYLSGLTCSDENVCQKSNIFKSLYENNMALIAPDTSPRNEIKLPGETDSWDFGAGAGFYLDATVSPWKENYRMYSYITSELIDIIYEKFPQININSLGITGHSMGGHGALTIGIRKNYLFKSVSAFAPICNPINSPWGIKAFTNYLGTDKSTWNQYDACELIKLYGDTTYEDILIDIGLSDNFLQTQLLPQNLIDACILTRQKVTLRLHKDYDHSYYFVSTFMDDHVKFHKKYLS